MVQSTESAQTRIRVLVVEPHAAVRHAIVDLVNAQEDMELVAQTATYDDALVLCARTQPDIILMAIAMQGISAASTARTIRSTWPGISVLCMGGFQEEAYVPAVLQAGAAGYLLKNITAETLASSIRHICTASSECPPFDRRFDARNDS